MKTHQISYYLQASLNDYQKAQIYLPLVRLNIVDYGIIDLMLAYRVAAQLYEQMNALAADPADEFKRTHASLADGFKSDRNHFADELVRRRQEVDYEFKHLNQNLLEISRNKQEVQDSTKDYLATLRRVAEFFANEQNCPDYVEILDGSVK